MVEELPELHHHVCVPRIWKVLSAWHLNQRCHHRLHQYHHQWFSCVLLSYNVISCSISIQHGQIMRHDWKWWSTSSGWFLCDIQRGFGRLRELRPPRGSSRLSCVSFSSHLTWLIICQLTQGDNPACPALKQVQVTRILAPRDADYEVPTKI